MYAGLMIHASASCLLSWKKKSHHPSFFFFLRLFSFVSFSFAPFSFALFFFCVLFLLHLFFPSFFRLSGVSWHQFIVESCASPSKNLISLSYSMVDGSLQCEFIQIFFVYFFFSPNSRVDRQEIDFYSTLGRSQKSLPASRPAHNALKVTENRKRQKTRI